METMSWIIQSINVPFSQYLKSTLKLADKRNWLLKKMCLIFGHDIWVHHNRMMTALLHDCLLKFQLITSIIIYNQRVQFLHLCVFTDARF